MAASGFGCRRSRRHGEALLVVGCGRKVDDRAQSPLLWQLPLRLTPEATRPPGLPARRVCICRFLHGRSRCVSHCAPYELRAVSSRKRLAPR